AIAPVLQPAIGEHDGIHRAGAGTADALETDAAVFEQGIERAPGECSVGAATLQPEIDGLDGGLSGFPRRRRTRRRPQRPAQRAVQPPSNVIVLPVMLPAPGPHRKRTASAMSSVRVNR